MNQNKIINQHTRAIFFDLDGTLVDSSQDITHAVNHMLQELNYKVVTLEQVQKWIGNGSERLVRRALACELAIEESTIELSILNNAMALFNKHYALCGGLTTCLYKDVKEVLNHFRALNIKMCIITNKPQAFTPKILTALGIDHFFNLTLCGDSLATKKPDPAQLFYALDYFNVDKQQAVMVGDSKSDILAANAAGLQSICVTYGYNHGQDPRLLPATGFIDNFKELRDI